MITVAIIIPVRIASEDFLISISSKEAIREPVHAPVPGSGIPTNSVSPQNSYFLPDHFFPLPVFQFLDQSPENLCLFHHLENLSDEKQNKGNGDNIPCYT